MRKQFGKFGIAGPLMLAICFFQGSAFAEDPDPVPGTNAVGTSWTGAVDATWGTNANWSTGIMPASNGYAIFDRAFTNQPNLISNRTTGAIWMTTGVAQNVTISTTNGSTLTIQGSTPIGASAAIYGILIDNTSAFTLTISAPTKIGTAQTWANNSANSFTVTGAVNTNGQALTIDGTGNTLISGIVSGTGSVTKNGTGTLTFNGSPNTYSGATTVNGGTLVLAVSGGNAIAGTLVIGDGTGTDTVLLNSSNQINNKTVTINSSGVLDLNDFSDAIGSLTMTGGTVQTETGSFTLGGNVTTNASATSATISGTGGPSNVQFDINLGANRTFTIADGVVADDLVVSANIASGGVSLTKSGAGRMVLSGSNDLKDVQVSAGILTLRNSNALGSIATPTVISGATLELEGGISVANALKLNGSGTSGQGALVNVSGNNTYSGPISLASDSTIGSTLGTLTISGNLNGGGGRSLDFVGAGDTMFTGIISNLNNGLTMDGTGVVSLFGLNTYDSVTTINSGTIAVNSSSSLGQAANTTTINAGTLEVTSSFTATRNFILGSSSSTVQVDPGQTFTVGPTNTFSGTGTLNKTGTGTLVLSSVNTYTGGTNITAGTVQLGALGSIPSVGPVTISGGSTLDMQTFNDTVGLVTLKSGSIIGSGTLTGSSYVVESGSISAPLAGAGTMTKNTAGTVTLSGNDTFTGSTTVNAGTLVLATTSGSALGSTSSVTVNAGGTVLLGASNQIKDTAPMTLAGGTFAKGDFSEGSATAAGVGALTLSAPGSHIDFGTGLVGTLSFASFNSGGNILAIDNWTGTVATIGNSGTDRLVFNADQAANLSAFSFTGFLGATEINLGSGFWEVVPLAPIPEPSTWTAGVLVLGAVVYAGFKNRQRRRARLTPFSSPPNAEIQNMNNVTKSLAIVGALVVSLSAGPPLAASPADEINRAVAVRGLSDPARAPAKEFMTAFTAVVLRVQPAELPRYVAAAVKLRPDLAPKIVALAVRVSGNWHRDRPMTVSLAGDLEKTPPAERCELIGAIVKAAVAITPNTVAEIASAAAGADRDMRQCVIEAAVSAVPGAEAEIIEAVNATTTLPPLHSINNYRPLNPSDSAGIVVSPEKPPGS